MFRSVSGRKFSVNEPPNVLPALSRPLKVRAVVAVALKGGLRRRIGHVTDFQREHRAVRRPSVSTGDVVRSNLGQAYPTNTALSWIPSTLIADPV